MGKVTASLFLYHKTSSLPEMPPQPSPQTVRSLPTLPRINLDDTTSIPNGRYTFQANVDANNEEPLAEAESNTIKNKIWFKTGIFFLLQMLTYQFLLA